jgi:hypothetical protein
LFILGGCLSAHLAAGLIWEKSWLDKWIYRSTGMGLRERYGDNFRGIAAILLMLVASSLFGQSFCKT